MFSNYHVIRKPKLSRFHFDQQVPERLTHYLFRYPAKFHPPVARALIEKFTKPQDVILDPFCGSGTLLVEALPLGRRIIGIDVDPVATFVSNAKILPISASRLRDATQKLLTVLANFERSKEDYKRLMFQDLTDVEFQAEIQTETLSLPPIPNLFHWFRRYVAVDLGVIKREINRLQIDPSPRKFLKLCYASIIRKSSNADPVPVSGLEVTSHMLKLEERGRHVNPYLLLRRAIARALDDWEQFECRAGANRKLGQVRRGNATQIRKYIRKPVDVVITSPPYQNAVDYHRRHTLEMYWLDLIDSRQARLALRSHYIGLDRVPKSNSVVRNGELTSRLAQKWEKKITVLNEERARNFKHYVCSMTKCLAGLAALLLPGCRAIFVVGKNSWNGSEIPTVELFNEMAASGFRLVDLYWYPIKNRYMTYSRHNSADIDKEYVLVYERI